MSNVITLDKPQAIPSLASAAILVSVEIHSRTFTKKDKKIAAEVSSERGARTVAGNWEHELFVGDNDLKALLDYRPVIYNWIKRRTYDWAGSTRILPMVNYTKFMQEFKEHETNFIALRDKFLATYESKINAMAFVRGPMFSRQDYPPVEALRDSYSLELHVSDVPAGDFRVKIAEDVAEDLRLTYQKQANRDVERILQAQIDQLVEVLDSLSRGCGTYVKTDKDGNTKEIKGRVYESTIERALELCAVFRDFNTTGNDKLEEARARLQAALADVNVDQLRTNESLRVRVKSDVDDILSKFGALPA